MSQIEVPTAVLMASDDPALRAVGERGLSYRRPAMAVQLRDVTNGAASLAAAADRVGETAFGRVMRAIVSALDGAANVVIPRITAAPAVLTAFLAARATDGWVWRREQDGHLHPYLVTGISLRTGSDPRDVRLEISLFAAGLTSTREQDRWRTRTSVVLAPSDVTRRTPLAVLTAAGLVVGTAELRAEYDATVELYRQVLTSGFAEQFVFTGAALSGSGAPQRVGARVIHDVRPDEVPVFPESALTPLLATEDGDDGDGPVPLHTTLRVFDLATHEFLAVNALDLTRYVYDETLREKLVLPDAHRELLDILTTDIDTFSGDLVTGKGSGNVILCKGIPGVGKTLTAEVYAELIQRPLYAAHSGTLGTSPDSVRRGLETMFTRAARWNVPLLLDEADVFVMERGEDVTRNAIVAEFLRTLEYRAPLLFMTTNRANIIDDAILSRCAAVISYRPPGPDDARRVWQVMAGIHGVNLDPTLVDGVLSGFPDITPRDIKMLLRLALRVAAHRDEPLSVDVFRQCGMFRGLEWEGPER